MSPSAYEYLRHILDETAYIIDSCEGLSREEIEQMFSLSELKQTRVYQEALEEERQEGRQKDDERKLCLWCCGN